MGKRCKCPSYGASNAYLMSFGDTMTALLAFFIVLNSLAKEQTGANLHAGTGSFIQALSSFGMPGVQDGKLSSKAFQLEEPSPLYLEGENDDDPPKDVSGPDEDGDRQRVIDRERDEFQRFLNEMQRISRLEEQPSVTGEVSFDVMKPLPHEGSPITDEVKEILTQAGPLIRSGRYEAELVVWATTPSRSAWTRAVRQAYDMRQEAVRMLRMSPAQARMLNASGRDWISRDLKRPAVSLTLRKLER